VAVNLDGNESIKVKHFLTWRHHLLQAAIAVIVNLKGNEIDKSRTISKLDEARAFW
jgi:hypothetical protein